MTKVTKLTINNTGYAIALAVFYAVSFILIEEFIYPTSRLLQFVFMDGNKELTLAVILCISYILNILFINNAVRTILACTAPFGVLFWPMLLGRCPALFIGIMFTAFAYIIAYCFMSYLKNGFPKPDGDFAGFISRISEQFDRSLLVLNIAFTVTAVASVIFTIIT